MGGKLEISHEAPWKGREEKKRRVRTLEFS